MVILGTVLVGYIMVYHVTDWQETQETSSFVDVEWCTRMHHMFGHTFHRLPSRILFFDTWPSHAAGKGNWCPAYWDDPYIYIYVCWETGKWFNLFYKGRLKNILWDRIIVTLQIYSTVGKQFKYILIYVVFPHKKSLSEKWCGKNNHNGSKLHLPHSMALNWGNFPCLDTHSNSNPLFFSKNMLNHVQ